MIVISEMATNAGIGRSIVVSVVTGDAIVGNGRMGTVQLVYRIVYRESSRLPSWFCGMACCTGIWNARCKMVGVGRLVVICSMAITAKR